MTPFVLVFAEASEADSVRPGWIPLIIVLLLGAFIAFLFFSMRKQLNKIDIPGDESKDEPRDEPGITSS